MNTEVITAPTRRSQIEAAIADLSNLHCADEAARPAMLALKLTRLTLESLQQGTPTADS